MLELYDWNRNKVPLTGYTDLCIESELSNADKTLSFQIPVEYSEGIQEEYYIRTSSDEYVIKECPKSKGSMTVTAKLNIEELDGTWLDNFESTDQTIKECMNLVLAYQTGWRVDCSLEKKRSIKMTDCYIWDIVKQVISTYAVEIKIDSIHKIIYFSEQMGEDKGTYLISDLNLKSTEVKSDTYQYYTRLIPVGKDGLTIEDVNNGKKYVEDYHYSNKIRTFYWKDDKYTNSQILMEDARLKLKYMSSPLKAYSCEVVDLAKDGVHDIFSYSLGDIITLIDRSANIKEKQRIVKITEYPDDYMKNTCELSNVVPTFEQLANKYETAADTVNNITTDRSTIDGSAVDSIKTSQIADFDSAIMNNADIKNLSAENINISKELSAVKGTVGEFSSNYLKTTVADVTYAKVDELKATDAKFEQTLTQYLKANEAVLGDLTVEKLLGYAARFAQVTSMSVMAGDILTFHIASNYMNIADGFIKSAMISELDAGKINTGILSTEKIRIQSDDGRLSIIGNTLQINDKNKVTRVQIGRDQEDDYSIYVWDASGTLMFSAKGLESAAIKKAIIVDDMISEDANISAGKINVESIITKINESKKSIAANKISFDGTALDIKFNSMTSDIKGLNNTIGTQQTNIEALQGNISQRIWKSDINEAAGTINSNLSKVEQNVNGFKSTVSTTIFNLQTKTDGLTNDLNYLQIGGRNLLTNSKTIIDWHTAPASMNVVNNDEWRRIALPLVGVSEVLSNKFAAVDPNTAYTVSVLFRSDTKAAAFDFTFYSPATGHYQIPATIVKISDVTYKAYAVGTTKAAQTQIRIPDMNSLSFIGGTYFEIAYVKLEKGNKPTDWTPAIEDVQNQINSIATSASQALSNTKANLKDISNIKEKLPEVLTQYDAISETIKKTISDTAQSWEIQFDSVTELINSINTNLSQQVNTMSNYFKIVNVDNVIHLKIGSNLTNFYVDISETKISFMQNSIEIAYLSDNKLYIKDVELLASGNLKLGNFAFVPRSSGNLSFKYIKK